MREGEGRGLSPSVDRSASRGSVRGHDRNKREVERGWHM